MAKKKQVKFTKKEIESLENLRNAYAFIQNSLGNLEIQRLQTEQTLETIHNQKIRLETQYVQEQANEFIESLPRGVLTFYESDKGRKLSAEEYKIVCNNTKIITQRAIMGANITDAKAFNLYTANGGTTGKYAVNWNDNKNKCFAKFTVKPLEGTSDSVTVEGEALGFLRTSIDTRVYFIKNF